MCDLTKLLLVLAGCVLVAAEFLEEPLPGDPDDEAYTAKQVEIQPVVRAVRSVMYGEDSSDQASEGQASRSKRQINFGGGGNPFGRPQNRPPGRPTNVPGRGNGRPVFPGQGGNAVFPGQGNNAGFPGQGNNAGFPGQGNNAVFPGQGGSPNTGTAGGVSQGQCPNCVSFAGCHFVFGGGHQQQTCNQGQGVCCPDRGQGSNTRKLFTENRPTVRISPISSATLDHACQQGINFVRQVKQKENELSSAKIVVKRNTPESGHGTFFKTTPSALDAHAKAQQIMQASKSMVNELKLSPIQGSQGLRSVPVRSSILANNCPVAPNCNPRAKYRTIDGTCNNLANPIFGRSETAFQRILPPYYDDGVSAPRTRSVTGSALPNERIVASNVLVDRNDPDQTFTLSVMQWAQFIDHDLTHAPFPPLASGEGIECCHNGQELPPNQRHPECWPINIPANDPFYASRGMRCMNFVRSMLGLNQECTFGFAEQMNQITHWLDGSNVYGSNNEEARRLRLGRGGLLKVSQNNLLPLDPNSRGECQARARNGLCYHAGDSRVNEQPGLTAIHTLFHREHNRVARSLQALHPTWSDEALFQEARRIVVAQMQHIIFNEWLPIIVGPRFMDSLGINLLQRGFSFDYAPNFNPNMNNEFATGAFRFGHSLVQGTYQLISDRNTISTIQLREHFNSPHIFQQNPEALDMFSRAFTRQSIQKFDSFVTDDLSNHLFQPSNQNFGMDLMSLNLHRGRDHAIAPYNSMREVCGLPKARTFEDFNDQIPIDIVQRLKSMYAHPDDVDFFVGGMSEKPVSGGLLGWTFLCVVGDQFARIKKGDRFFYDMGGQPSSFTEFQLNEIRKTSWARILCDNSNNLRQVQPLAFRKVDNGFNKQVNCQSNIIPRVDLNAWAREQPAA